MNVLISGGTGFVGKALVSKLSSNHKIWIVTRYPEKHTNTSNITYIKVDEIAPTQKIDAVINLAGETINGRWTKAKKDKILSSRLTTTQMLIKMMSKLSEKPAVFINASAIGYYGVSDDAKFTEHTTDPGDDFLASVVSKWESEASKAEILGIRTVFTRFGMILGKKEGALPKMVLPYKLFVGGPLGSGEQWISWVHIDDVVGLIEFSLTNTLIEGPLNVTAPQPVKMNEMGLVISKLLNRPHLIPTPAFALKLLLGEMSILVLEGQHVLPEKALKNGYKFKYADIKSALENILSMQTTN